MAQNRNPSARSQQGYDAKLERSTRKLMGEFQKLFPDIKVPTASATSQRNTGMVGRPAPKPRDASVRYEGITEIRATQLQDSLREGNTVVTGDTLDFETLSVHDLKGTTLTPTNILALLEKDDILYHVWVAAKRAIQESGHVKEVSHELTEIAMECFFVELGKAILDRVAGPHLTFIDPRQHNDTAAMVKNARRLYSRFEKSGVTLKHRIVISIPATEEGIAAAKTLQSVHEIQTNLTLVSGLMHAAACAEAGATAATISIGPLMEWYEERRRNENQTLNTHPGIETIQSVLAYFELHKIKTKLIGADFRSLLEITPLRGLDAISLSKEHIEQLRWSKLLLSQCPPETSPPSVRARQAQYPTMLLTSKSGFMAAMSAATRSSVAGVMYAALGRMKVEMELLETVVEAELKRQVALKTLDLKTLYRFTMAKPGGTPKSSSKVLEKDDQGDHAGYLPIYEDEESRDDIDTDDLPLLRGSPPEDTHEELIEGVEYF